MRIKERISKLHFQTLAPTVAVFVLFLLAFVIMGWNLTQRFASLQEEISGSTRATRALLEMARLRGNSKEILLLYRISEDTKYLAQLNQIEMERSLQSQRLKQEVEKIHPGSDILGAFSDSNREIRNLRQLFLESVSGPDSKSTARLFEDYSTLYEINSSRLVDLHALIHSHLTRAEDEMRNLLHKLPFFLILLIAVGGVVALSMVRFYRHRVLKPLTLLHGGLSAVSSGRLGDQLQIPQTASEIKDMLKDFNDMTSTLQKTTLELTQAREEAMQAANIKSEFLANMSHEIRTPLNVIVGLADLLSERPLDPESKKEIQILRKSSGLLLGIVNDILDYSRLESGQVKNSEEAFLFKENIENVTNMIQPLAQAKNLLIEVDIPKSVPDIMVGDSQLFEQALLNLANNAVKFTERGRITIEARMRTDSQQQHLEISIQDTGIGIKPDILDALFTRFVQADSSITRTYGGTGLGLAIVKQIMNLYNGDVAVQSTVGFGTRFTLRFPYMKGDSALRPIRRSVPANFSGFSRPPRILLADDSDDNRFLVKKYLKNMNAEITEAQNGREVLSAFASRRFDIVLMDIQMPEVDGYQATREIRRMEKEKNLNHTPIIALTAFALKEEAERSVANGCDAHMAKPIRKNELLQSIEQFL